MPVLSTEFREPHNFAQDTDGGGIHDDAVAKKVGMRGGTVAGSIHINQCAARSSQPRGHPSWHDAAVLVSGLTLLPLLPPQVRTALHPGVWCRGMVLKRLLERLLPQPNGAASPRCILITSVSEDSGPRRRGCCAGAPGAGESVRTAAGGWCVFYGDLDGDGGGHESPRRHRQRWLRTDRPT